MKELHTAISRTLEYIERLDPRSRDIFDSRIASPSPVTLETLGQRHGTTRERMRQIEAKILQDLTTTGLHDLHTALNFPQHTDWVRHWSQCGDTKTQHYFDPSNQPFIHLLNATRFIELHIDGFFTPPTPKNATSVTDRIHQTLKSQDISWNGAVEHLQTFGLSFDLASQWLTAHGYINNFGTLRTSKVDAVTFVRDLLHYAQKPLNWETEIAPMLALHGWNTRGVLGRIQDLKDQFTRTDVHHYALAELGLPTYTSISEEIAKVIDKYGPTNINLLVELITSKFEVAGNSVRSYAALAPFTLKNNIVSYASQSTEPKPTPKFHELNQNQRKGITTTPYGFEVRIPLNHDRLRGSGMPVSFGYMSILGMTRGEMREVPVNNVPGSVISFKWNRPQPHMGTIRALLVALGAQEGQTLLLEFSGTEGNISHINATLE